MIDSLSIWQSTFEALSKQEDWTQNFADWVDNRVTNKMDLIGVLHPSGNALSFTFNKSTFKSALELLPIVSNKVIGVTGFANAWESALLASSVSTLSGSYIGSATPTTTWSVVNSTVLDAPGIAAGKAKILELANDPNVGAGESKFPEKFMDAFLLLTVTTTGLDSTPTPAGPLPLNDASRAVK